jgi:hypothetical protein
MRLLCSVALPFANTWLLKKLFSFKNRLKLDIENVYPTREDRKPTPEHVPGQLPKNSAVKSAGTAEDRSKVIGILLGRFEGNLAAGLGAIGGRRAVQSRDAELPEQRGR